MITMSNTELTISSVSALRDNLERSKPQLVISIVDPDAWDEDRILEILEGADAKVLPLRFHHVESLSHHSVAPSMDMARTVEEFIQAEFPDGVERLLVHCGQGESRSPSVAMLALGVVALQNSEPSPELAKDIVDKVYEAAPGALPNMRTVEIADSLLGFHFDLIAAVKERTNPKPEGSRIGTAEDVRKQGIKFKQAKTKKKKRKLAFRP